MKKFEGYKTKTNMFSYLGNKEFVKDDLLEIFEKQYSLNPSIDTYVEPFMGGIKSFISIHKSLLEKGVKKIVLNDYNSYIVEMWSCIKNNCEELVKVCHEIYPSVTRDNYKDRFYQLECLFNMIKDEKTYESKILRSSLLILTLRFSFNGFYGETKTKKLNMNVTTGYRDVYRVIESIKEHHEILKQFEITFHNRDYKEVMDMYKNRKNVYMYIDSPYLKNNSNYITGGFGLEEQLKVCSYFKDLPNFCYSNVYREETKSFLLDRNYSLRTIKRSNRIGKKDERKKECNEILLYGNYMNRYVS